MPESQEIVSTHVLTTVWIMASPGPTALCTWFGQPGSAQPGLVSSRQSSSGGWSPAEVRRSRRRTQLQFTFFENTSIGWQDETHQSRLAQPLGFGCSLLPFGACVPDTIFWAHLACPGHLLVDAPGQDWAVLPKEETICIGSSAPWTCCCELGFWIQKTFKTHQGKGRRVQSQEAELIWTLTWDWLIRMGSSNTVQMTTSEQSGVVREPL